MGKTTAVPHTKKFYLAYGVVGASALAAALWMWAVSSGATREDRFGPEIPGASWGALLVAAIVVAAVAGGFIVLTRPVPRVLRWAVSLTAAISAGTVSPIAMLLLIRPSLPALLVAAGVLGMGVAGAGAVRAPSLRDSASGARQAA
ncbi:hypothetical protein [Streptomyces sp. NPDC096323]|uniref:hypothetical protein n=1 Tax=Streptomyces sp. NPDC096323 TaxID=3155822 RepID=UPI003332EDA4